MRNFRPSPVTVEMSAAELGLVIENIKRVEPMLAARLAQVARNHEANEKERARRWEHHE